MVEQEADEYDPPKCVKNLRWYFMEYCNNTSIHGFKYLGERRSSVEKLLWWVVVLTCSLYFCVDFIIEAYHKWERSPVIVSFATSETPIWSVPFPAVTICPRTKAMKSKYNFTKMALSASANQGNYSLWKEFNYMTMVCPSQLELFVDNETVIFIDREIVDFLYEVHPNFERTVAICSWTGINCSYKLKQFFVPTITSEGICYSFNMLDKDEVFTSHMTNDYSDRKLSERQPASQWTLEEGYTEDATLYAFPRRTLISGPSGGLDLTFMTLQSDLDYLCGDALQGYDVILHHPAQMPITKAGFFRIGLNQDVIATVKPNMMRTSNDLIRYSANDRNCYFIEDKKLRFFKVYNQQDCLLECLANFTLMTCHCVEFYMPRDNLTAICGVKQQRCLNYANTKFLEGEVSFRIENDDVDIVENLTDSVVPNCNCLQSCNSLSYDASISQSDWDWKKGKVIVSSQNETDSYHLSRLRIYFKDMQFITSQRNELYGKTDFFANCGGLLGLFTGFSIISLAEIVYFVTLRFTCNFRKHGKHYWSGAKELMKS